LRGEIRADEMCGRHTKHDVGDAFMQKFLVKLGQMTYVADIPSMM